MFARFGKWLRPNAEDVTLEVIGVIKGTQELRRGYGNEGASFEASEIATRADKVLRREGHVINADVKELLTRASELFGELGVMESSRDAYRNETVVPFGTTPLPEANPRWEYEFAMARRDLDKLATRVFAEHFAPQIREEIKDMSPKQLARKAKREPEAMALLEGHLRKPPRL
tara:strand:+ start:546 stop:1064 length:519 start_codon:yes stop_codon:yes gene_type:complete